MKNITRTQANWLLMTLPPVLRSRAWPPRCPRWLMRSRPVPTGVRAPFRAAAPSGLGSEPHRCRQCRPECCSVPRPPLRPVPSRTPPAPGCARRAAWPQTVIATARARPSPHPIEPQQVEPPTVDVMQHGARDDEFYSEIHVSPPSSARRGRRG